MAAIQFLFGFDGRVARGRFWLFGLTLYTAATLALAFDPALHATLKLLLWAPTSIVLVSYIFAGMLGFSVAVLSLAADLAIIRGYAGYSAVTPIAVAVVLCFVLGWMVVAVGAKRLHDRGKSGWWLVVFVIAPLVFIELAATRTGETLGALFAAAALALHVWSFYELGCRRGERGGNRYGPDPLAGSAEAPAPAG
jgi:uncharacterized membrane protein YhaH (DUF805 family)